jgi:hypothetical protein
MALDKNMSSMNKNISKVMDNKNIIYIISGLLILYSGLSVPKLLKNNIVIFDNVLVRLLVAGLIVYVSYHNTGVALLLAIAFVLSIQELNLFKANQILPQQVDSFYANHMMPEEHHGMSEEHNNSDSFANFPKVEESFTNNIDGEMKEDTFDNYNGPSSNNKSENNSNTITVNVDENENEPFNNFQPHQKDNNVLESGGLCPNRGTYFTTDNELVDVSNTEDEEEEDEVEEQEVEESEETKNVPLQKRGLPSVEMRTTTIPENRKKEFSKGSKFELMNIFHLLSMSQQNEASDQFLLDIIKLIPVTQCRLLLNAMDRFHCTPLHVCALMKSPSIHTLGFLLTSGANPNHPKTDDIQPPQLLTAIQSDCKEEFISKLLTCGGASVHGRDKTTQQTAGHFLVNSSPFSEQLKRKIATLLLKANLDFNAVDKALRTMLHFAIFKAKVCQCLFY